MKILDQLNNYKMFSKEPCNEVREVSPALGAWSHLNSKDIKSPLGSKCPASALNNIPLERLKNQYTRQVLLSTGKLVGVVVDVFTGS
jgi:hypothetical protein